MIKAVIFDMDGTLVDTERLGIKAWKAGAAELGLAIDEALIHQFIGRTPVSYTHLDVYKRQGCRHQELGRSCRQDRDYPDRFRCAGCARG